MGIRWKGSIQGGWGEPARSKETSGPSKIGATDDPRDDRRVVLRFSQNSPAVRDGHRARRPRANTPRRRGSRVVRALPARALRVSGRGRRERVATAEAFPVVLVELV